MQKVSFLVSHQHIRIQFGLVPWQRGRGASLLGRAKTCAALNSAGEDNVLQQFRG